ncbi:MAG TPA: hypothetical protein VK706_17210 [Candidatus Sulfotelmatobacter sp.]|jgi:hypothetical protein|nr:hypothetical protein [Candidatus Sulfotelmatobacter sp.]
MTKQQKRDQWLQDIDARQRNIVFPNTVENETRFWRNLGTGPSNTTTKLGLAVLAIFVFGLGATILVASYKAGAMWSLLLALLLFCGPLFGAIAWATRRSLRDIEQRRRNSKMRGH